MAAPLAGVRVIEVAGIGAGPFCGMMLADMGAEVVLIDRAGTELSPLDRNNPLLRNRRSVALDLKTRAGVSTLLQLIDQADVVFEAFRPGVAERLGFGPHTCLARNPRLIYGRMTGWGQDGPLAQAAGHDLNYIALSGALHMIGARGQPPVPPLNLVGDFGGGGMMLAFGIVCGLLETRRSGRGQVIDASMLDGAIALTSLFHGLRAVNQAVSEPGTNLLSGAAHFYTTYETADGRYVSIAALEPQFYDLLIAKLGLDPARYTHPRHPFYTAHEAETLWPELKEELARLFRSKTRDEWDALLLGTDACYAPVLDLDEAPRHPHNQHRGNFIRVNEVQQNAPAPRFAGFAAPTPAPPREIGADTDEVLRTWGFSPEQIESARQQGAFGA